MLCEKCTSIHFKRPGELPPSYRALVENDEENEYGYLYHIHQESFQDLLRSKDACLLCRKIWHGLCKPRSRPNACRSPDPGSPVWLSISLGNKYLSLPDLDDMVSSRRINVSCSPVGTSLVFAADLPDSVRAHLEGLSPHDDTTTLSSKNIELARIWLQNCRDNHRPCRQLAGPGPTPLRTINISDPERPFLVTEERHGIPYACLSYKWGGFAKYLTTTDNVSRHHERIPLEKLPRTFREAFDVARALGFTRFWTDALCVRHDVPAELEEQMARMGTIYGSATLTLFAAAGDHSNHGLRAVRDGRLYKPSPVRLKLTVRGRTHENVYFVTGNNGEAELPLRRRGWVLQEECLSARGLWFGHTGIFWTCLCENAFEGNPGITAVERIDRVSLQHQLFMHIRHMLRKDSQQLVVRRPVAFPLLGRDKVEDEWYRLVMNFTKRELTYPSDVLPALSGIASKIAEVHGLRYVAGLWVEDLQLGLLWQSGDPKGNPELIEDGWTVPDIVEKEAASQQYDDWVAVSGLGVDDWDKVVSTGTATFSWISHFLSGRSVDYNLYRKYALDTHLGIQVLDVVVTQPPMYKNPLGEILSASLKVRARVKTTKLPDKHVAASASGPYKLLSENAPRSSTYYVADFYPDSLDMLDRLSVIHCVLCAVAWEHHDRQAKDGKQILNCIGVVSSSAPGQDNQFVRVGLVRVLEEEWFMGGPRYFWNDPSKDIRELELV